MSFEADQGHPGVADGMSRGRSSDIKAADVMMLGVVTIRSDASVPEAARLMLERGISGLPVVDLNGNLVGIVTEGDFLRRAEAGTERRRPRRLELALRPGRLAEEHVHAHGRKVAEVMTREVVTIAEDTPVEEIVRLMEQRRIKRVPVLRGNRIVGIVSRANLVRALVQVAGEVPPPHVNDRSIRQQILSELQRQAWARDNNGLSLT